MVMMVIVAVGCVSTTDIEVVDFEKWRQVCPDTSRSRGAVGESIDVIKEIHTTYSNTDRITHTAAA